MDNTIKRVPQQRDLIITNRDFDLAYIESVRPIIIHLVVPLLSTVMTILIMKYYKHSSFNSLMLTEDLEFRI